MSLFPFGLFLVLMGFGISIVHLKQSVSDYYDFVAFMLVFFGTSAVFAISIPWQLKSDVKLAFERLFKVSRIKQSELLAICAKYLSAQPKSYLDANDLIKKSIFFKLLQSGEELIELGFEKKKIEAILRENSFNHLKRQMKIVNAVKGLGKYPPAFGLMGTVLGLVNVMNGVSQGVDGKQTALKMAIALVATMYGLVVSNAVVFPAAESILKELQNDEMMAHLAIETVLLKKDDSSLLEAQEILNTLVPEESRLNFLEIESSLQQAS